MQNENADKVAQDAMLKCAECLKRIPASQAYDPQGGDETMNFCGLECYEAWSRKVANENKDTAGDKT